MWVSVTMFRSTSVDCVTWARGRMIATQTQPPREDAEPELEPLQIPHLNHDGGEEHCSHRQPRVTREGPCRWG